jgi:hypothetical protein
MGKVVRLAAASAPASSERARSARLTKRLIEQLLPDASGDRFVWDHELRGFGVRLKPSGVCTYIVQYRDAGGRTRRLALGRHGVLTAEQARKRAMQRLAEVAGGGNPSVDRKRERARAEGATVADVLNRYMAFVEQRRKPSTVRGYKAVLDRLLLPKLGKTLARDLTAQDVRDWHMRLSRTPITANRAQQRAESHPQHKRANVRLTREATAPDKTVRAATKDAGLASIGRTRPRLARVEKRCPS